jgi:hypothetical protein
MGLVCEERCDSLTARLAHLINSTALINSLENIYEC